MNDIIFLGSFFPEQLRKSVIADSKGKMGMSNHNFEMSILNGLCSQKDLRLRCITVPGVYSYPYNNKRFYTRHETYSYGNAIVESVPFVNLPFIKELVSTFRLAVRLIRGVKNCEGRVDIIVNTPNCRLLIGLFLARFFIGRKITQTVIIPDIPIVLTEMDTNINPVKHFILNLMDKLAMNLTSRSNGLVLLTESMTDFFEKPIRHIVMEGLVDLETKDKDREYKDTYGDKEIILYTGTIRKMFGVMNLVAAFRKIERQNVELWICGSGDACAEIERISRDDPRIRFFGMVSSEEALNMQSRATILVNPRTSEGHYTKYSFPSKTVEYMLSGKAVIINRLPGIPDEYYDFVHIPRDEGIDALADCMNKVLDMDKDTRASFAENAKQFIVNKKNSRVQVAKILQMIDLY